MRALLYACVALLIGLGVDTANAQALHKEDALVYGPGCPWCASAGGLVIPGGSPQLHVSIKWCGVVGSPAVNNPTLVCQNPGDFKTMLWRRHERASDCIWIPQALVTLRSGGVISLSDYTTINDLSTTVGVPGDIVISPPAETELDDTWAACDFAWQTQPKGIVAVSANRLIDNTGTVVARGVAYVGSITRPWMAVADPTVYCQLNERSLAHEFGHVMGLNHVTAAGNLMQTGGSGALVTYAQATTTRTYITNNPILDPRAEYVDDVTRTAAIAADETDRIDFLVDGRDRGQRSFADLRKLVVVDKARSLGDLELHFGVEGLLPKGTTNLQYAIALDIDNDVSTGGAPTDLIPQTALRGIDYVLRADIGDTSRPSLWEPGEFDRYVPVLLEPRVLSFSFRDIIKVLCDPEPSYVGPTEIPTFTEFVFTLKRSTLERLGLPASGPLFPNGLRAQLVVMNAQSGVPEAPLDVLPDSAGVMPLRAITFPAIEVPGIVRPGERVPVRITGMWPNADLGLYLGEFKLPAGARSDAQGNADFTFEVPKAARRGHTLLTVGVMAGENVKLKDNAVTADVIIEVQDSVSSVDGPAREEHTASFSTIMPQPVQSGESFTLSLLVTHRCRIDIRIVDALGHVVGGTEGRALVPGVQRFSLNVAELGGRPLVPGCYWVSLVVDGVPIDSRPLVVIR